MLAVRLLGGPRMPLLIAGVAALVTLPSLTGGLMVDDYHHKLLMQGSDSPVRLLKSPWDMFSFFTDGPQRLRELMDLGFVPWWTYEGVRAAFWRPLASATHWLDYKLWPEFPSLMHLHSVLWYAAAAAVVAMMYRRFIGPALTAGLAALLYAMDDVHGAPVGFLANRSDLPAMVLCMLCLIAHDGWRREGRRWMAFAAPVLLAAGLLCKEAAIAVCGYLAAYELFLSEGPARRRLLALLPYAAVVVGWRLIWKQLGYGVAEMDIYVDPAEEPARYLAALAFRGPLLLLSQWAGPPADIVMPMSAQAVCTWWWVVVTLLMVSGALLLPAVRRDRLAPFWATGMLLSLLPASTSFPSDRMLMFTGVGAMPLVVTYIGWVRGRLAAASARPIGWAVHRLAAVLLIIVHFVVAPLSLMFRSAHPFGPTWTRDRLLFQEPLDESVTRQDLVVINPPEALFFMASPLFWASENLPLPRRMRFMASSRLQPVEVYRPDDRTLVVSPAVGFLAGIADRLVRTARHPFSEGDQVHLTGMTVEILRATDDGRPVEAAFRFDVPLEDPSLRWLMWRDGAYVPFTPPPVGQTTIIEGTSIRRMLMP